MDAYAFPSGSSLRFTIEINSRVVAQICLELDRQSSNVFHMPTTMPSVGPQDAASLHPDSSVVGRIDAAANSLHELIRLWCEQLAARKRKERSIVSYKSNLTIFVRERGISSIDQINSTMLDDYLTAKVTKGEWKGTTLNRNLCAFRSFLRFARRRGLIDSDPLVEELGAADDGDEGARAASTDEARLHLATLWEYENQTARRYVARFEQTACKFLAGMRAHEPGLLQWDRHMDLDGEIAAIRWTKDIQKNRRLQDVAICPELAQLLREHRDRMRQLGREVPEVVVRNKRKHNEGEAKTRLVHPDDPGAYVFPWVSPRTTFRADRDRSGIKCTDSRGRGYSPHSARKWFDTQLIVADTNPKLVDFLMRHRGGTSARYPDFSLKEQAGSVQKLPTLLPEAAKKVIHNLKKTPDASLTDGLDGGHDVPAKHDRSSKPSQSNAGPGRQVVLGSYDTDRVQRLVELFLQPRQGTRAPATKLESTTSDPEMPIRGSETVDLNDVAELVLILGRLLKGAARARVEVRSRPESTASHRTAS